jgi:sugar phosphate permease
MYMAGCLVAPFAASPIASAKSPSVWYLFYTVPAGLGAINLAMCLLAFRSTFRLKGKPHSSPANGDPPAEHTSESQHKAASQLIKRTLKQSSLWYISVFFFFYLGMTLTASGWVVEYLVDVRDGDLERVSYVPAGFSGGCLLGRLLLPEPTHKYGERLMGTIYLTICLGVQLVFWLYVVLTPSKSRVADQSIQGSEHHRSVDRNKRIWVLLRSSLCCRESCSFY